MSCKTRDWLKVVKHGNHLSSVSINIWLKSNWASRFQKLTHIRWRLVFLCNIFIHLITSCSIIYSDVLRYKQKINKLKAIKKTELWNCIYNKCIDANIIFSIFLQMNFLLIHNNKKITRKDVIFECSISIFDEKNCKNIFFLFDLKLIYGGLIRIINVESKNVPNQFWMTLKIG